MSVGCVIVCRTERVRVDPCEITLKLHEREGLKPDSRFTDRPAWAPKGICACAPYRLIGTATTLPPPWTQLVPKAGHERHRLPAKQSLHNGNKQNRTKWGNSLHGPRCISVLRSSCFPKSRGELFREIIVAGVLAWVLDEYWVLFVCMLLSA